MIKAYFIGGTQDLSVRMLQHSTRHMKFPIVPKMEARAFRSDEQWEPIRYEEEEYTNITRLPDGSAIYVPTATL